MATPATVLDCTKCGENKPVHEFSPHVGTSRGFQYWCKSCHRKVKRDSYANRAPSDDTSSPELPDTGGAPADD
eukprot:2141635-Alexandrium_andersonii.AAC.1